MEVKQTAASQRKKIKKAILLLRDIHNSKKIPEGSEVMECSTAPDFREFICPEVYVAPCSLFSYSSSDKDFAV